MGVLLIHAAPAQAATDRPNSISELLFQLRDPWTWFGLGANALFFMRFAVQWIVSERRKRSTVPVAFWYLSLAGASCLFIYGCHLRNLVVMLAGLLPCAIYIRNLMLIHGHTERLRRAGLPTDEVPVRAEQDLPS